MHDVRHVFVVFGDLGEDLAALSRKGHVWLAGTAANQRAAEVVWEADADSTLLGVTTFTDHDASAAALYDLLPMVDLHHAAWAEMHVRGLSPAAVTVPELAAALGAAVRVSLDHGGFVIEHATRSRERSRIASAAALELLDEAVPGFRAYVASDENIFDPGSVHGLFLACSFFVQEHEIAQTVWESLAALMNRLVGGPDDELDNAACTCFLEGLAERDHALDALLRGEALAYWRSWCGGP